MSATIVVNSAAARRTATLLGGVAIVLWSSLALFTALTGAVPPLQLTACSFAIGFLLALAKWLWFRESIVAHLTLPPLAWAVGVAGLFGYHALYFLALRLAPPAEASLLNYLWPLLIVLFSALLPGERLRWFHLAAALAGLAGTALLVTGGGFALRADYIGGYAAALACALVICIWPNSAAVVHSLLCPTALAILVQVRPFLIFAMTTISVTSVRFMICIVFSSC